MECPACGNALTEKTVGEVALDVCEDGCGGVWFDWFELKKFDEVHEAATDEVLDVRRDKSVTVDPSKRHNCPRCEGVVMMRHHFSIKKDVEVDECAGCGGFWLDAGELAKIRSLFETEQERHQAAQEYFEGQFAEYFAQMEENARHLRKYFVRGEEATAKRDQGLLVCRQLLDEAGKLAGAAHVKQLIAEEEELLDAYRRFQTGE